MEKGNNNMDAGQILCCQKCGLYKNQKPVLNGQGLCDVMWIGLSAKKTNGYTPLHPDSDTGRIIKKIEMQCKGVNFYKTNLVKCPPVDESGKLRYPNKQEMNACMGNLYVEITGLKPKLVFLLGNMAADCICQNLGIPFPKLDGFNYQCQIHDSIYYIHIHHPSYIHVYKRKMEDEYIKSISGLIKRLMAAVLQERKP